MENFIESISGVSPTCNQNFASDSEIENFHGFTESEVQTAVGRLRVTAGNHYPEPYTGSFYPGPSTVSTSQQTGSVMTPDMTDSRALL